MFTSEQDKYHTNANYVFGFYCKRILTNHLVGNIGLGKLISIADLYFSFKHAHKIYFNDLTHKSIINKH